MTMDEQQTPTRLAIAAFIYAALVVALVASALVAVTTLGERRATADAAQALLAQLEGRILPADGQARSSLDALPQGSPFLEGQTLTIAGAALLQRVADAVSRQGGNVLSSQVDLQRPDVAAGWLGLIASCDLEESRLQALLYDLESGMPFLFVERLVVQAPVAGVEGARVRVLLAVAGKWKSIK
jgi:general secretion pathway protein M